MSKENESLSLEGWYEEIAKQSGTTTNVVKQIHSEHGIEPQSVVPVRKAIRFKGMSFSGTKIGTDNDGPFSFEWQDLDTGLFGVFSEEVNLVGKSTILNLFYSVLRGNFSRVTPITMDWIGLLEADFSIGSSDFSVRFETPKDAPSGQAVLVRGEAGKTAKVFDGPISDLGDFMNDMFMAELSFDKMYTTLKKETLVQHGWPALASALFVSSSEGAIVGDNIAGYSQRLLQTFIGLPWISTQSRASAIHKILLKKATDKKIKGPDSHSSSALAELKRQLNELPEQSVLERQVSVDEGSLLKLDEVALETQRSLNTIALKITRKEAEREVLHTEWLRFRRLLQARLEERNAGLVFRKLQPVCCPSCESTRFRDADKFTSTDGGCPLCKDDASKQEIVTASEDLNLSAEVDAAETNVKTLDTEILGLANERVLQSDSLASTLNNQGELKKKISDAHALSAKAIKRNALDMAIKQLESAMSALPADIQDVDQIAIKVMSETNKATKLMFSKQEAQLFSSASQVMKEIAEKLGVKHLKSVQWTSTKTEIHIADTVTTYSNLSPGEKLRFRIAASITIAKISAQTGQGRHPGILFFDSAKSEEITDHDFDEIMRSISELAEQDDDLQIFVSSVTRKGVFEPTSFTDYKLAKGDEYLF